MSSSLTRPPHRTAIGAMPIVYVCMCVYLYVSQVRDMLVMYMKSNGLEMDAQGQGQEREQALGAIPCNTT
jgi:hypothetical protein